MLGLFEQKVLATYYFKYPAEKSSVNGIKEDLTQICKKFNFIYKDINNIMVFIDEAASNVIRHAYKDTMGEIEFEITVKDKGIWINMIDHGLSFDWKKFRTPDLNNYVRIGKKGGLGVWIIRKLTDKNDYKVTARGNEMLMVKYHTRPSLVEKLFIRMSARGIKNRFILATAFFILLIVGGVYAYFIYNQGANIREKYIAYNSDLVKSIAQSSKEKMINQNSLGLIKLLKEIKINNENIDDIFIIDNTNNIVAHNNSEMLFKQFTYGVRIHEIRNAYGVKVIMYGDKKPYGFDITNEIVFQSSKLGEVHLQISDKSMNRVMLGKGLNLFLITLLVFFVAILGIFLLLKLIMKPLDALRQGALAIGDGRLDHRIEMEGEDEFTQIANAFNEMSNKFKGVQVALAEQEKMQQEIQVAKEIQHTLLPKNIPDTEGFDIASYYKSAKEVGGDYYDINLVGPHMIGVIVADVSGKGVPGSLVMTIIRTAIRLISFKNHSAKNVLVKVNDFVKDDMKKGMFVTAFYMVLDSITRKINFVSAGHDPLILFRAKENRIYYIKPKGFPLGISLPDPDLFEKVMTEESVRLEKDDMIVIYTDGITEAMNGKRAQFGEKRFVDCIRKNGHLSSAEFIEKLSAEIQEFTMGYPQNDDITIVAVKEKKSGSNVLRNFDRRIDKLKAKGLTEKEIEKKLGIKMDKFEKIKENRKDKAKDSKNREMKFFTFEQKKTLNLMIVDHPEWTFKEYTKELGDMYSTKMSPELIKNELKRLNLLDEKARQFYAKERRPEVKEAAPPVKEGRPEVKEPAPPPAPDKAPPSEPDKAPPSEPDK